MGQEWFHADGITISAGHVDKVLENHTNFISTINVDRVHWDVLIGFYFSEQGNEVSPPHSEHSHACASFCVCMVISGQFAM